MTREEVVQHLHKITGGRMPEREARLHATAMELSLVAISAKLDDSDAQRDEAAKLMQDLCLAALAYARPIVAKECAVIAELHGTGNGLPSGGRIPSTPEDIATAIREHGKEGKS